MAVKYPSVHEVTYYQARCTKCGVIEDDYGEYSAWANAGSAIDSVVDNGWYYLREKDILLCDKCQQCEVCQDGGAYDIDGHLVCEDHEDHNFTEGEQE